MLSVVNIRNGVLLFMSYMCFIRNIRSAEQHQLNYTTVLKPTTNKWIDVDCNASTEMHSWQQCSPKHLLQAVEVLELSEAYLAVCGKKEQKRKLRVQPQTSDIRLDAIAFCCNRLRFTVQRFLCAVNQRQKTRIYEWLQNLMECIEEMMHIGHGMHMC